MKVVESFLLQFLINRKFFSLIIFIPLLYLGFSLFGFFDFYLGFYFDCSWCPLYFLKFFFIWVFLRIFYFCIFWLGSMFFSVSDIFLTSICVLQYFLFFYLGFAIYGISSLGKFGNYVKDRHGSSIFLGYGIFSISTATRKSTRTILMFSKLCFTMIRGPNWGHSNLKCLLHIFGHTASCKAKQKQQKLQPKQWPMQRNTELPCRCWQNQWFHSDLKFESSFSFHLFISFCVFSFSPFLVFDSHKHSIILGQHIFRIWRHILINGDAIQGGSISDHYSHFFNIQS